MPAAHQRVVPRAGGANFEAMYYKFCVDARVERSALPLLLRIHAGDALGISECLRDGGHQDAGHDEDAEQPRQPQEGRDVKSAIDASDRRSATAS